MTHDLQPTEYLYRGHYIKLNGNDDGWLVTDVRDGNDVFFSSPSIDDCIKAIDEVMADIEAAS